MNPPFPPAIRHEHIHPNGPGEAGRGRQTDYDVAQLLVLALAAWQIRGTSRAILPQLLDADCTRVDAHAACCVPPRACVTLENRTDNTHTEIHPTHAQTRDSITQLLTDRSSRTHQDKKGISRPAVSRCFSIFVASPAVLEHLHQDPSLTVAQLCRA